MAHVEIRFKCRCMAAERLITVPARRPGEDLGFWMAHVVQASIYIVHRTVHPTCDAVDMEYAKIPMMDGAPMLGGLPPLQ